MAIRVSLTHTSRYRYDREVTLQPHVVRLRPAPHCRTPILAYSLRITPEDHFLNWQQDPFGNYQARLVFSKPAQAHHLRTQRDRAIVEVGGLVVQRYAKAHGVYREIPTDTSDTASP